MGTPIRTVASQVATRESNSAVIPQRHSSAEDAQIRQYGIVHQTQIGRSDCFIVAVRRRGRAYTRRFAFSKHGGLGPALKAAIAWRNARLAEQPVFTLREFHNRVRSNNTSGVPGVTFLRPANQPEGLWQAKISRADGCRLCRKFSVRKFGFDEAFARAVAARSEFIASVPETAYLMNPIAKRWSPTAVSGRGATAVGNNTPCNERFLPAAVKRLTTHWVQDGAEKRFSSDVYLPLSHVPDHPRKRPGSR